MVCTLTAAWQKIFDANPRIGFLAHADKYKERLRTALSGASQIHGADAAGHLERLCQCIAGGPIHAGADQYAGIRYPDGAARARTGGPTAREAPFELLPVEAAPGT